MSIGHHPTGLPLVSQFGSLYIPAVMQSSREDTEGSLISRKEQLTLILAGVICITLLSVAACLRPHASGYGTHQQLGLPPCSFQMWFGIPCPSCGGTTAFTHFVRGQWVSSFQSNAAACLFAGCCVVGAPWSFASAWKRRYLGVSDIVITLVVILLTLAFIATAQWVGRLAHWWA